MSFRIEEKILIDNNHILEFKNYCIKEGSKKLYSNRKIKSLYFDNESKRMFSDSLEGVLPRKKIRVREYPENKLEDFFIEEKISSTEGRFKKKKKINKKYFLEIKKNGFFDSLYGLCKPVLYVEYYRSYMKVKNYRITHDTNIRYKLFSKEIIKSDMNQIFEIKTDIKADLDELALMFPMNKSRFSKYSNGIELFHN